MLSFLMLNRKPIAIVGAALLIFAAGALVGKSRLLSREGVTRMIERGRRLAGGGGAFDPKKVIEAQYSKDVG
ncbi:MAG: hypothetical protein JNL39_12720, partial [Opitutaceae bacterium]|nr:hypothetical protein [Opitutaceae bacterium]